MKRLFWAGALALALHALLLSAGTRSGDHRRPPKAQPKPISLALRYKAAPKPMVLPADPLPQLQKLPLMAPNDIKPATPEPAPTIQKSKATPQTALKHKPKPKLRPKPQPETKREPKPAPKPEPVEENAPETLPADSSATSPTVPAPRVAVEGSHKTPSKTAAEPVETASPPANDETGEKGDSSTDILVEATPAYHRNPPPAYPRMARRRGYEGTVVLSVLVNAQGVVEASRVHRSCGHETLDDAALKAVRNWIFTPGRRGDKPAPMWVTVPIRFQLR